MTGPAFATPRSLAELATALKSATAQTSCVAGATDLTLRMRAGRDDPDRLIDLRRVAEMRGIRVVAQHLVIGATTTFEQIAASAVVQQGAACLAEAARRVGSTQVRGVATLGGNVANASACADAVAPLLVLGADVGILSATGIIQRRPIAALFAMAGGSALSVGEVIVDFRFRALDACERSAFSKIGVRTSIAVSKLNAAAVVALSPDHATCLGARIAFGSLAVSARLADGVAGALTGRRFDDDTFRRFTGLCSDYVDLAIPDRSSRPYKRSAVRGLADDLWAGLGVRPLD